MPGYTSEAGAIRGSIFLDLPSIYIFKSEDNRSDSYSLDVENKKVEIVIFLFQLLSFSVNSWLVTRLFASILKWFYMHISTLLFQDSTRVAFVGVFLNKNR